MGEPAGGTSMDGDAAYLPAEGPPRVVLRLAGGALNMSLGEARGLAERLGALIERAEAVAGEAGRR